MFGKGKKHVNDLAPEKELLDGGIDADYRAFFGIEIKRLVQTAVTERPAAEPLSRLTQRVLRGSLRERSAS